MEDQKNQPAEPVNAPIPAPPASAPSMPTPFRINRLAIASNVTVQILLALIIVLAVNFIASRRQKGLYGRWDLSVGQKFELSPMTKKLLASIQKPVEVIIYTANSPIYSDVVSLLQEYELKSNKAFLVKYVNPYTNPTEGQRIQKQYKVGNENNVIVILDGRHKVLTMESMADMDQSNAMFGEPPIIRAFKGEAVITAALIELTEGKQSKIYVIQGHGETDMKGRDLRDITSLGERQNLMISPLTLANVDAIPADADMVMILGPRSDYSDREIKLLQEYWEKNGHLFITLNPLSKTAALNEWIAAQGIKARGDSVVATHRQLVLSRETGEPMVAQVVADTAAGTFVPDHPCTADLENDTMVFFGRTQSLELDKAAAQIAKVNASSVIDSVEGFWGEMDYTGDYLAPAKIDDGRDRRGPFPIAVAAERGAVAGVSSVETGRLVVMGNSDWLGEKGLRFQGAELAGNFAMNSINWMLKRETLVGIPPKDKKPVVLQVDDRKLLLLALSVCVYMPCMAGIIGLGVWMIRRN